MLDGREGKARQKAMDLLVRYAEALGAERFVDTNNVAGVPGLGESVPAELLQGQGARASTTRSFRTSTSTPTSWSTCRRRSCTPATCRAAPIRSTGRRSARSRRSFEIYQEREAFAADHGVEILKTCTPYLAGNVPANGEHCAWMESSAVVYCNSVLGARTNTEGRESTSAAMLTGKIPDWGLHRDEQRLGTHRIDVERAGRERDGLGHARLLRRRRRAGAHSGAGGQLRPARPRPAQALRRRGVVLRRRRDVPHRRRHAGGRRRSRRRSAATSRSRSSTYGAAERRRIYERSTPTPAIPTSTT